jgi:hypothetical protein
LVIHESGKTYAMRQITSVQCIEIPADNSVAIQCIIWGGIGLLCFGLGIIPLVIGIILMCMARSKYALAIHSASGEAHALIGEDEEGIDRIVRAINKAIIG